MANHMSRKAALLPLFALGAALGVSGPGAVSLAQEARPLPPPLVDEHNAAASETAIVAGGCFWGVQGVFQHVRGIASATSGYAGGEARTADYETVSGGSTGHAESVRIVFDPRQISYGNILQIFFSVVHDPTEKNRQGPDFGTQYRSAVFPATAAQADVARKYIAQLDAAGVFRQPIATRVESSSGFFAAESYHQNFLTRHPQHPYIVVNDLPKIEALRQAFPTLYRPDPVLVAGADG
jgi:peptide-methionine (S)-S-oxide reductase